MYNKDMTNTEQTADDNSYARISEDSVEIFGQVFPLERPRRFESGRLRSFAIKPTIIKYRNREIPVALRIYLHEDGKFHGAGIYKKYIYEHKGRSFLLAGASGLFFYPSGNIEQFTVENVTETDFIVDGKPLTLYQWDSVSFYEESGLPKVLNLRWSGIFQGKEYNVIEISETGEIICGIMEKRPDYDFN